MTNVIGAKHLFDNDANGKTVDVYLGTVHPASAKSVKYMLSDEVAKDTEDGRSEWLWLRFPNGDLMFACFPQGDSYFNCEKDAETPLDLPAPAGGYTDKKAVADELRAIGKAPTQMPAWRIKAAIDEAIRLIGVE